MATITTDTTTSATTTGVIYTNAEMHEMIADFNMKHSIAVTLPDFGEGEGDDLWATDSEGKSVTLTRGDGLTITGFDVETT